MSDLHKWEEVHNSVTRGDNAILVHRMAVPGGWMYVYTFMKFYYWRRNDIHVSSVFVPDPTQGER